MKNSNNFSDSTELNSYVKNYYSNTYTTNTLSVTTNTVSTDNTTSNTDTLHSSFKIFYPGNVANPDLNFYSFTIDINDSAIGWDNYLLSENIYDKIADLIFNIKKPFTNQCFENHLYGIVYRLLYELTIKNDNRFENFFMYDTGKINYIIHRIIEKYHELK